jgi:hypothetical protein
MGVEPPITPIMIVVAAPDGAPPRRNNDCYLNKKTDCPAVPRRGPEAGSPRKNYDVFLNFIVPV